MILQRIFFGQLKHRADEFIHQYIDGLKGACKFAVLHEEMISDPLAEHTNDPKNRERLITAPGDLTLTKAVEIAFESAAEFASQLAMSLSAQAGSTTSKTSFTVT